MYNSILHISTVKAFFHLTWENRMVKMAWDLLLTSFIFVLAVALNNRWQMKN